MPPAPSLSTPNRLRRLACMLYEGVLLFGVVFIAAYAFDTLTQSHDGMALRHLRQAVVFIAVGFYFVFSWQRRGQTLPMKTWHIRLLMHDGSRPGLGRLIARYLLLWPLPLLLALAIHVLATRTGNAQYYYLLALAPVSFFLWTWVDPQAQFLHDRVLGTRLVNSFRANRHAAHP